MKEIKELSNNQIEDISIILNEQDASDIQAIIQGPAGTPYEGGSFRVRLKLSSEFPQVPPKGFFVTKIFHPNVSRAGEICVDTLKRDWKPEYGIKHILQAIRCLLIEPNPESALNEEAGKLLLDNYDDYCKQAKLFTTIHAATSARKDALGPLSLEEPSSIVIQDNNKRLKSSEDVKKRALKRL